MNVKGLGKDIANTWNKEPNIYNLIYIYSPTKQICFFFYKKNRDLHVQLFL